MMAAQPKATDVQSYFETTDRNIAFADRDKRERKLTLILQFPRKGGEEFGAGFHRQRTRGGHHGGEFIIVERDQHGGGSGLAL